MFIGISILLLIGILASLFYFNITREKSHQYRYRLINQLRQLIYLTRQHRALTHAHLAAAVYSVQTLKQTNLSIIEILQNLKLSAGADTGPEIRVLYDKTQSVLLNWTEFNVAKNQLEHGRLIRQMMFLTDEVMIEWLIDTHHDDIAEEYHHRWQKILDTLESLTRFRISIQDIDTPIGQQRFRHHAVMLSRRMNQLSLICPLTMADNDQNGVIQTLKHWEQEDSVVETPEQLYQLSLEASYLIFNVYDQILSETCEEIYLPLEAINQNNWSYSKATSK
ncbi:hypothetical protein [Vibrio sp. CK2-1]|uniref:hypothetical protein n=1 Tax=Vibrio sp. CK2-1 TaxID=2912249 RepID=UPI001F1A80A3|nr:hypothetical protein [Vibrio sp. CK2-1]MCF7354490.1 hypothetical protein [Vibrio sp. CK2-1]